MLHRMFPDKYESLEPEQLDLIQPLPKCKCRKTIDSYHGMELHCVTLRCKESLKK